jgi:membrane protease YdiL (CAAX protease family)
MFVFKTIHLQALRPFIQVLIRLLERNCFYAYGESQTMSKLSMGTLTLVCLRAGVAEEVFFRGYIYERLATLTQNKGFAVTLSAIPFALCHFSQGWAGVLIAFVGGGVLMATYLWKKNLTSNIIAHFAIDFTNYPEQASADKILVQKDAFGRSFLVGFRYKMQ